MMLRPYQERAITELWDWFRTHEDGHPVVEACVGAGKSVMIAELCRHALTAWKGTRILMIVHVKELIEQNHEELVGLWPDAPVGIHSASVGRKDIGHDILYCGIGSIYKKAHLMGKVDLVLIDECHLISTKDEGMYRQFLNELQRYNPHMRVIGWTGTAFRGNGVWLTDGDAPLFTHVAARVAMKELLKSGFLAPLTTAITSTKIDTSNISIQNGDYNIKELAAATDRADLIRETVLDLIVKAEDRKKWLVFCVTVDHARHVCDELQQRGVGAEVISANTTKTERERIIGDFKSGRLRAICNVAVLTTGFNVPAVDCIALLRATKSPVLYTQIMGRGMRIHQGKSDCLVLDYTDTVERLGPVDAIAGHAKRKKKDSLAPIKICEECGNPNPISAIECIECGAQFEVEESDPHRAKASQAAVLSTQVVIKEYTVTNVTYAKHQKPGKAPSLRVEYWNGFRIVAKEWIGIESDSPYARSRASHWWYLRSGGMATPGDVDIAVCYSNELRTPAVVIVNETGKYPEITGYRWSDEQIGNAGRDQPAGQRFAAAA